MIKRLFFPIIACLTVFSFKCSSQKYYHRNPATQVAKKQPTITVWIHGTRNSQRIPLPGLHTIFKTIRGLHHASAYKNMRLNNMTQVIKRLNQADPQQFPLKNLYVFGWSGLLGVKRRKNAAENLYNELSRLISKIKKKEGVEPKLRVITHSHGGNVSLHLAEIQKNKKTKIKIDELVLLACPVQKRTSSYMSDTMFKTIYHFYSPIDLTQVIDPQIIQDPNMEGPNFSERTFPEQKNLIQLDIGPIMHVSFFGKRFLKRLPKLLDLSRCKVEKQLFLGAS